MTTRINSIAFIQAEEFTIKRRNRESPTDS